MRKLLLSVFAISILCQNVTAQSAYLKWVGPFTGMLTSHGVTTQKVSVDNNANSIVLGEFIGTIDFAIDSTIQANYTSVSFEDEFIAKYNPAGALLWVYTIPAFTTNAIRFREIKCDNSNNIILTGTIMDTVDVDASPAVFELIPADSQETYFIMKIDAAGNFVWALTSQQPKTELTINALTVTITDDILLAGNFRDSADMDFGPGIVLEPTLYSNTDGYLMKIDASGNYIWHRTFEGSGDLALNGILVDETNTIYCYGGVSQSIDFDPGAGVFNIVGASTDAFVVTLDASGNFIRAWKIGSNPDFDSILKMVIDENGFLYILGYWVNTIDFDSGPGVYQMVSTGSSSQFLIKMNKFGHGLWVDRIGDAYPASNFVTSSSLTYDQANGLLLGGQFTMDYDFDPSPTDSFNVSHSGAAAVSDGFVLNINPDGTFNKVIIYASQGLDAVIDHGVSPEGLVYVTGLFSNSVDFDPGPGVFYLTSTSSIATGFLTCINSQTNFASGNVFRDMNLNGTFDAGDFALDHTVVHTSEGRNFMTASDGYYIANFDTGTITLSYYNLPPFATAVPVLYTVSNPTYGNTDTGKDFAVQVPAGTADGSVVLTESNTTRPGFNSYIHLAYTNNGTTTISGEVTLVLDPQQSFISSVDPPTSVVGDTLHWIFSGLQPQQSTIITIRTLVSASASIGSVLHNVANLYSSTGDVYPVDNVDSLDLFVTGSFDPNDKKVFPSGDFTTQQISNGEYLEYLIRFQNTGTDTAFIVQVLDTLSPMLDIATFEVMAASHPYILNLSSSNILRFIFDNILLPDSNINEEMSHGFVRYRIKPMPNAAAGTVINNAAAIYFDYNEPVITNTVSTNIVLPTSVSEITSGMLQIFPNPVNDVLTVSYCSVKAENLRIEIYNLFGQRVAVLHDKHVSSGNFTQTFDISNLTPGNYFIQLHGDSLVQGVFVKM